MVQRLALDKFESVMKAIDQGFFTHHASHMQSAATSVQRQAS
jgi:hypothetical protein